LKKAEELGFKVPKPKVVKTLEEIIETYREWEKERDRYIYELDGMVVK